MPEPRPDRKLPIVKFTLAPRHPADLDAIGRAIGIEGNRSAVVRRLIDERVAMLPKPAAILRTGARWAVARWTPEGVDVLADDLTREAAEDLASAAAANNGGRG